LQALGFLLGGQVPTLEDRTFKWGKPYVGNAADIPRIDEVSVTGEFSLSAVEQEHFGLPEVIRLRRKVHGSERPVYEVHRQVPVDEELRGIDNMNVRELRELAVSRGVDPEGDGRASESWYKPLSVLAAAGPQIHDWVPASPKIIDQLPTFLLFSSRDEPEPESQVRSVLHATYKRLLDDTELVKPVRELEETIKDKLQAEAEQLCAHIQVRVPELTSVSAIPSVSFRDGFSSVQLRALKGNEDVGLRQAGSGRQRLISLAVWEWISMPRAGQDDNPLDLVIAYDEPDTHLDYGKQRGLVDLIHAQCQAPGVRMIVATHSLNLIDRVDISDVVQFRLNDNDRTVVECLGNEDTHEEVNRYLSQISTAMGLRTSVLLHERCFLAVEGETEEQAFPLLFKAATGKRLQSAGIALICGKGNHGALKVTEFLIDNNRAVAFIVDKDSAGLTVFKPEKLRHIGVKDEQIHFVGDPNELEELFSDQQWADTATEVWARSDGRAWSTDDIAALRGQRKFSAKLQALIEQGSGVKPSKPDMNLELAIRVRTADEVPEELREAFEAVACLASGELKV
jgi:hypothetical protein